MLKSYFSSFPLLVAVLFCIPFLALTGCDTLNENSDGGGAPLLPSNVLAVDADASGDTTGASWENAYTDLQMALDSAQVGDEVWVATGTYVPSEPRDPSEERTASFVVPPGVGVYGGFTGTEQERQERNPEANAVILSGDRGAEGESSDNSYHVVMTSGSDVETILRGVTIENGNANGEQRPRIFGGGLHNDGGRLAVRNVTFRNNRAAAAGGLYDTSGVTRLEAVTFQNNRAVDGAGGGAVFNTDGQIQLRDVTFRENEATTFGGGLFNVANVMATDVVFENNLADGEEEGVGDGGGLNSSLGQLTLRDVEFVGNEANDAGGGAVLFASPSKSERHTQDEKGVARRVRAPVEGPPSIVDGSLSRDSRPTRKNASSGAKSASGPSLENVVFRDNVARRAGGLLNQRTDMVINDAIFENNRTSGGEVGDGGGLLTFGGDGSIQNVTFENNEAARNGGGIDSDAATTTAVDVIFEENQADSYGGGVNAVGGEPTYVNTLFVDNEAGKEGGAIGTLFSRLRLNGVTITQNRAQEGGDGFQSSQGNQIVSPDVVNTIIWGNGQGNTTAEVLATGGAQPRFVHSDVEGSGGSGNWNDSYGIDGNGNLDRDPQFASGSTELTNGSPVIDAGIGNEIPAQHDDTDLDDEPRVVDGDGDGEEIIDMGVYEYQP